MGDPENQDARPRPHPEEGVPWICCEFKGSRTFLFSQVTDSSVVREEWTNPMLIAKDDWPHIEDGERFGFIRRFSIDADDPEADKRTRLLARYNQIMELVSGAAGPPLPAVAGTGAVAAGMMDGMPIIPPTNLVVDTGASHHVLSDRELQGHGLKRFIRESGQVLTLRTAKGIVSVNLEIELYVPTFRRPLVFMVMPNQTPALVSMIKLCGSLASA